MAFVEGHMRTSKKGKIYPVRQYMRQDDLIPQIRMTPYEKKVVRGVLEKELFSVVRPKNQREETKRKALVKMIEKLGKVM